MVFYTDRFIPEFAAAATRLFVILIRPKYKDDIGILEHEKVHAKQFWRNGLLIHSYRYLLSKKYRLNSEIEAYAKQSFFYEDDRIRRFAESIVSDYNIGRSVDDVENLLRAKRNEMSR